VSFKLVNQVFAVKGIQLADKMVLLVLAAHTNHESGLCCPGQKVIADASGLSTRTVISSLQRLAAAGHISITSESSRGFKGESRFSYKVHPSTGEVRSPVTHEVVSPVTGEAGDADTCKPQRRQVKMTVPTGENGDMLLLEGTRDNQKRTRREQAASPSPAKGFIDCWCSKFETRFGYGYQFAGGRDGAAVKRLLKGSSPIAELLDVAEKAWSQTDQKTHWNCVTQAVTIAGFESALMKIRTELSRTQTRGAKPNHEKGF